MSRPPSNTLNWAPPIALLLPDKRLTAYLSVSLAKVLQVSLKSVKACLVESVQEAMATESRLRKTEDTVSQRLDRLVDKRRQLQVYCVD